MKINASKGTIDEMINAFKGRIDELSVDSSTDITASDSNLNTYLVTIGLDLGGPEDGPIFKSGGEELVDARSPEEAEQIIYDRYGKSHGFDSCLARLATQKDIDEFMNYVNEPYEDPPFDNGGYEYDYDYHPDDRIWSDRFFSSTNCSNESISASSIPLDDYYDFDSDTESTSWTVIDHKSVPDSDGFWTDYTWYQDEEGYNVFVFGDRDLYDPDNSDWDWECESYEEALEWFDDYEGFVDDDIDSCTKPEKNDASKDDLETITSSYDFDPDTYLFDLEQIVYQKIAGPHPCVDDVVMSEDTVWGDGYGVTVSFDPLLEINDYYQYIPYDHLYGDEETDASTIAHYCELSVDFKELDQKVI